MDLPPDIAAEKMEAAQIRAYYKKGRVFPIIRSFRALRQRAPGELAKTIFSVLLSIAATYVLLGNYNAKGLGAVLWMIYLVAIIGACFWATSRLWRMIGLRARNIMRYLVGNMWSLAITAITAVGLTLQIFFPHLLPEKEKPRPAAESQVPAVTIETNGAERKVADEVPAKTSPIYAGEGWKILAPETIANAHARCRTQGTHWYLAEGKDVEMVVDELIAGGHTGTFWTGERRDDSYLHYEIIDGEARFMWSLAAKGRTRNVLCIDRDTLGGGVAIIED